MRRGRSGEAVEAGLADGVTFTSVFLVGGYVADALVDSHRVPVFTDRFELGAQHDDVVDGFEARALAPL